MSAGSSPGWRRFCHGILTTIGASIIMIGFIASMATLLDHIPFWVTGHLPESPTDEWDYLRNMARTLGMCSLAKGNKWLHT